VLPKTTSSNKSGDSFPASALIRDTKIDDHHHDVVRELTENHMNKNSLTYIIGTYPGLTTTFIDREIRALQQQGVRVRVISIRRPHTILSSDQAELQKITSYLIPTSWHKFIAAHLRFAFQKSNAYFGTLFELINSPHPNFATRLKTLLHFATGVYAAQLISEQPCDHLHAHFVDRASTVALVAGKLLKIPYSVTAHANDIYINPILLPLKLSQASFVATCTEYNRQHLQKVTSLNGKIRCLYHGLDLESYPPSNSHVTDIIPTIISVGQLKEKKGFQYLLQACQILKSKDYIFNCQIIGEGNLRAELERQISELALQDIVTLRGALPHESVIQEYQRSTLFVLPCITGSDGDRDGIPNVILEAMAMQLPVISTQHSGIPEVIKSGVNGLLVPPADADGLAHAIATLIDDPSMRTQLGKLGRKTVMERFNSMQNARLLFKEMVQI
jgi:glycosyltransferase involved in cell wall biosynthesis